jgi:Rrf2 family protein
VLQRLAKNGLVKSSRGPQGGFTLAKKSDAITLLDVYEAIEGPLRNSACLMRRKTCSKKTCILGDSISSMWSIFRKHLGSTKISDIAGMFQQEEIR